MYIFFKAVWQRKKCNFEFTVYFGLQENTLYWESQNKSCFGIVEYYWNAASGNLCGGWLFTRPFMCKKHSMLWLSSLQYDASALMHYVCCMHLNSLVKMVKICFGLARSGGKKSSWSCIAKISTIKHCNLVVCVCVFVNVCVWHSVPSCWTANYVKLKWPVSG